MAVVLFFLLAAASQAQPIPVIGWDDRPTVTVAEGYGRDLAPIKPVAEKCGFSRTWVWDDDTDEAQIWVLAEEATREKTDCLNQWRAKHQQVPVKWKIPSR